MSEEYFVEPCPVCKEPVGIDDTGIGSPEYGWCHIRCESGLYRMSDKEKYPKLSNHEIIKRFVRDAMYESAQYPMTDDGKRDDSWPDFLDNESSRYASAIVVNLEGVSGE